MEVLTARAAEKSRPEEGKDLRSRERQEVYLESDC